MTTPKCISNYLCLFDTQDQLNWRELLWKIDATNGGMIETSRTYKLQKCDFQFVIPKDQIKIIIPQIYVMFTSGVTNTYDGTCATIMRGSDITTTQSNLNQTIFLLNLTNTYDISIPGDTTYSYFIYSTEVPYEIQATSQIWNGKLYIWDYRNIKTDPYDLQYFDATINSQFPYLKPMLTPTVHTISEKKYIII